MRSAWSVLADWVLPDGRLNTERLNVERTPATSASTSRTYGHDKTIHRTERLDVEVNAAGEVVAVWFRCQQLPFRQSFADGARASVMRATGQGLPRLVAVEVVDD